MQSQAQKRVYLFPVEEERRCSVLVCSRRRESRPQNRQARGTGKEEAGLSWQAGTLLPAGQGRFVLSTSHAGTTGLEVGDTHENRRDTHRLTKCRECESSHRATDTRKHSLLCTGTPSSFLATNVTSSWDSGWKVLC